MTVLLSSISPRYLSYMGICFLMLSSSLHAKVFSDIGTTFEIAEESFLSMIQRRLERARTEGKLASLEEEVKARVKETVITPPAVSGLQKTQEERSWYFDPSITLDQDIRDHESRLIHPKGTRLNPLTKVSWHHPMVLIDGSDAEQVSWAISQVKEGGKIVLVKGSPIKLYRETGQRFYFDQRGRISQRFQIKHIPARITQEGLKLLIEEVRGAPETLSKNREKKRTALLQETLINGQPERVVPRLSKQE